VLVLAADVKDFLQCIRLQDLTYCARIDYTDTTIDIRTQSSAPASGISSTFRVRDRACKLAQSLAHQWSGMNGTFHKCDVVSSSVDMQFIKDAIESPHESLDAPTFSGIEMIA
jgi:hypothetical protein